MISITKLSCWISRGQKSITISNLSQYLWTTVMPFKNNKRSWLYSSKMSPVQEFLNQFRRKTKLSLFPPVFSLDTLSLSRHRLLSLRRRYPWKLECGREERRNTNSTMLSSDREKITKRDREKTKDLSTDAIWGTDWEQRLSFGKLSLSKAELAVCPNFTKPVLLSYRMKNIVTKIRDSSTSNVTFSILSTGWICNLSRGLPAWRVILAFL